jgi:hypothetical protein
MNSKVWFPKADTVTTDTMPAFLNSLNTDREIADAVMVATDRFAGNFVSRFGEQAIFPLERMQLEGNSWQYSLVIFVVLLMLVVSRQAFQRKFSQTILAVTGNNHLNQLLREWNPVKHPLGLLYTLSYLLLFSLFLYEVVNQLSPHSFGKHADTSLFFIIIGIVTAVLAFKFVMVITLAALFRTYQATQLYLAHQISFMLLGSLVFFPFILILVYNPSDAVLAIALVVISSLMIYRLIRSFFVSLVERQFGLLYLFLYLCTLEIVPLLMLVKAILLIGGGVLII